MEEVNKKEQRKDLEYAILKETRERLVVPAFEGRSEAENTADWIIHSFSDYLDKLDYIRNMNYLARAVGYYLLNSKDNEHFKSEAMKTFESVLVNDEAYKEASDYLFILRYALEEVIKEVDAVENSNIESIRTTENK